MSGGIGICRDCLPGRVTYVFQTVPLFAVTDEHVGLLGARVQAHRLLAAAAST